MSFENLPSNWPELPLHDARHAANVVDLVMRDSDRVRNSLLLLPANSDGVPYPTPIVINDCDWRDGPGPVLQMWEHFVGTFESVLIATSHRDTGCPGQHRSWLTHARNAITALGTPVLGCYVAARDDVYQAM